MPAVSPYVKSLSRETGRSPREIERLWARAKEIAAETFGVEEEDFGTREYEFTAETVRNMLGLNESVVDPSQFIDSELDARSYLETLTSGSFNNIGPDVNPPDEETKTVQVIEPAEKDYEVTTRQDEKDNVDEPDDDDDEKDDRQRLYDRGEDEEIDETVVDLFDSLTDKLQ